MNPKQKDINILIGLVLALLIINYPFIDKQLENFFNKGVVVHVERIIDGDTIETGNQSVRLLGINSPERGEQYYNEAKEFLESRVFNKTVRLEFGKEKYDKYKRLLAYVYLENKNINLELVENGFANYYFPSGKDKYYNSFKDAWNSCIDNNVNLCEKSINVCSECIELKELNVKEDKIILYNSCNFQCELTGWTIKDEGRKKFVFGDFYLKGNGEVMIVNGSKTNTGSILYWSGEDYVWTQSGDTLFLRDGESGLVLWKGY